MVAAFWVFFRGIFIRYEGAATLLGRLVLASIVVMSFSRPFTASLGIFPKIMLIAGSLTFRTTLPFLDVFWIAFLPKSPTVTMESTVLCL